MKFLTKIFKQRKANLFNGATIRFGDKVSFINSDGEKCVSKIGRRDDGTLYFWNTSASITDYRNAIKESK
jgi:hypothetical protein